MTRESVVEPESADSVCPRCGASLPEGAEFCPFDGVAVTSRGASLERSSLIGRIIDERYEVMALIGEGGMGCVYRVRHRVLGRLFALKVLRPELAGDRVVSQRFVREAHAVAAIVHPNIVAISDFGMLETGQPYFVMELVEGRTLSSLLRERGALPVVPTLVMARQVASALGAAHDAGVIHRDLKPDNVILLSSSGALAPLKVLDFGLAMVHGHHRLTLDGVVFGTPYYMSPEQASGEPFDLRVDVYALGIMTYEVLTGRVPFEADSYMGVLTKQLYAEPRPLSEMIELEDAERPIESIIRRCLSKTPEGRYGSMVELESELTGLLLSLAPQELTETTRTRPSSGRPPMTSLVRRRRRRRLWLYAVFGTWALLLALLALYVYLVEGF